MAALSIGEHTQQQLWDDALNHLNLLSLSTVKRNLDLEARVNELELEISVWKQAHSVAIEASERESTAHKVQIATLNRQIANLDSFRGNQYPLILCVINGTNNLFNVSLLAQGIQGGRATAQNLTKAIADYLAREDVQIFGRLSFWITIYFKKAEYAEFLLGNGLCSLEQFEGFLSGFSQASPRFMLVDVGYGQEADSKIQEYVATFTRFSQTLRVFLGGCNYPAFSSTFRSLEAEHLLGKLVAIHGSSDPDPEPSLFPLTHVKVDDLFMHDDLIPLANSFPSPATIPYLGRSHTTESHSPASVRSVDMNLPLHKQNPPPCNEHYLMTCSKGAGACKYSHDYALSPEQLSSLAANAKKAPCNWLKNGLGCPYGENCCWGHVCPNGAKCFHLSKGKCWFKGEGMHSGQ